jgi:hypothetical protein
MISKSSPEIGKDLELEKIWNWKRSGIGKDLELEEIWNWKRSENGGRQF